MTVGNGMKGHMRRDSDDFHVWLTPKTIIERLGEFDLDPCAAPYPRPWDTAKRHITLPEDGLEMDWIGRIWMNPPFGSGLRPKWMRKMAEHNNGIMLIPASTETESFKEFVWKKATSIVFLYTRPRFCLPNGKVGPKNSGCSMCLVGYGALNDQALLEAELGVFVDFWRK